MNNRDVSILHLQSVYLEAACMEWPWSMSWLPASWHLRATPHTMSHFICDLWLLSQIFLSLNCPAPCRVWTWQSERYTLIVAHLFIAMNPTRTWASDTRFGYICISHHWGSALLTIAMWYHHDHSSPTSLEALSSTVHLMPPKHKNHLNINSHYIRNIIKYITCWQNGPWVPSR